MRIVSLSTQARLPLLFAAQLLVTGCSNWNLTAVSDALEERTSLLTSNEDSRRLADDRWILSVDPKSQGSLPEAPRWRHLELDEYLDPAQAAHGRLVSFLDDRDAVVAANAAILLGRLRDGQASENLAAVIKNKNLKLPQRQAAAEALGQIRNPSPSQQIEALLAELSHASPDLPELRADLLRSLARQSAARGSIHFQQGLASPSAEIRRVSLAAFARTDQQIPESGLALHADMDPSVRKELLLTLGKKRDSRGVQIAERSMTDLDPQVRFQAINTLGDIGTKDAISSLLPLLQKDDVPLRARALAAMTKAGNKEHLVKFANDPAWQVRKEVAASLGKFPEDESVAIAEKLLVDNNGEVQRAALKSLEEWPNELAIPLYLHAMAGESFLTRKQAAERLAAIWPPARSFPTTNTKEARLAAVNDLRQTWEQESKGSTTKPSPPATSGLAASTHKSSSTQWKAKDRDATQVAFVTEDPSSTTDGQPRATRTTLSAAEIALVELLGQTESDDQLAARAAISKLEFQERDLVSALQQIRQVAGLQIPEVVFQKVLPKRDEQFAALALLMEQDTAKRRRGAALLSGLAADRPLSPLAAERLSAIGIEQQDVIVWKSMFAAIANQNDESVFRLAYAGLGHSSPEVRRQACEYLGNHPHRSHGERLVTSLQDSSPQVVEAAAVALGVKENGAAAGPLEELLAGNTSVPLRLVIAKSLLQLDAPRGADALDRMAIDADPDVRLRAIRAISEAGKPELAPTLIKALNDQQAIRRAALLGLQKCMQGDSSAPVVEGKTVTGSDEEVTAWKTWWQTRQADKTPDER